MRTMARSRNNPKAAAVGDHPSAWRLRINRNDGEEAPATASLVHRNTRQGQVIAAGRFPGPHKTPTRQCVFDRLQHSSEV